MTFSSAGSTVRYPDLGCAGRLRPGGFDGDARVYRDEISTGSCDNDGVWKVLVTGASQLEAIYRPPRGKYVAVADLNG